MYNAHKTDRFNGGVQMNPVMLLGAGPGDPQLLSVRGRAVLETAEVVVYDRLVSPVLLESAPVSTEFFYVGKASSAHSVAQEEIQQLLIQKAREGKRVVRLKGGDPFIFGRGGEEAAALRSAQIPFQIIPGVSSAMSVPAYAGIPLTQRAMACSFRVVAGHLSSAVLPAFGQPHAGETLVILMGLANLQEIVTSLLAHGYSHELPVAVTRCGTTAEQATVQGTLADIASRVTRARLRSPAMIVVGETVHLRDALAWRERLPLFGKRILCIGETSDQIRTDCDQLQEAGAEVFPFLLERYATVSESTEEKIAALLCDEGKGQVAVIVRTLLGAKALLRIFRERETHPIRFPHVSIASARADVIAYLEERGVLPERILGLYPDDLQTFFMRHSGGHVFSECGNGLPPVAGTLPLTLVEYRVDGMSPLRAWLEANEMHPADAVISYAENAVAHVKRQVVWPRGASEHWRANLAGKEDSIEIEELCKRIAWASAWEVGLDRENGCEAFDGIAN